MTARKLGGRHLLLLLVAVYIVLPLLVTLLYSLATVWGNTVLPDGLTLEHWKHTFEDPRIVSAIERTLVLATATALLDLVLVIPVVYYLRVRSDRARRLIEGIALIPWALPWLVIGFAVRALVNDFLPDLQGSFIVVLLAFAAVGFPFVYWALDGAMVAADIKTLSEAAETCGAGTFQTLRRIVIPNVVTGILTGAVLSFAMAVGEFALIQVLAGSSFETLQIWSAEAFVAVGGDKNALAVVTILVVILLFIVTALVLWLGRRSGQESMLGGAAGGSMKKETGNVG